MKIVGLDVGYGFVKATDGKVGYSFPSVVGEGNPQSGELSFNMKAHRGAVDDLQVAYNDTLYYLGKSAIRHSNYLFRNLSIARDFGQDFEILFFGTLALFCDKAENVFKVVTGLPPDRMHLAGELEERLRGERQIARVRGGRMDKVRIILDSITIVPQPLGTYWAEFMYGDSAREGRVGIIDIGFGTSDLVAIQDDEYLPKKSRTINIGMSHAYRDISDAIYSKYGVIKEIHSLDESVIKKQLRVAGQSHDITPILEDAFKRLAGKLSVELHSTWLSSEFDSLLFTGGGSSAVSKYIMPQLPQSIQVTDHYTANSRGYFLWANRMWAD